MEGTLRYSRLEPHAVFGNVYWLIEKDVDADGSSTFAPFRATPLGPMGAKKMILLHPIFI